MAGRASRGASTTRRRSSSGVGVLAHERSPVAALVTDPTVRKWLRIKLLQAPPELRARVSGDLRDGFQSPRPAARTSPAANNRRRRSSSFVPTMSQGWRIACMSIMPTGIPLSQAPRNPPNPSQITTWRSGANRLTCFADFLSAKALDFSRENSNFRHA